MLRPFAPRFLLSAWSLCVVALAAIEPVGAQTLMNRPVQAGDVTGLEMSIEGARRAPRGGHVGWLLAVHEVVGLSDLRPAPHARVRLLSSLVREHPMAEGITDDTGRVELGFDVPLDAPSTFHVLFEAVSPRGVRRQFDLDVQAQPAHVLQLEVDRTSIRAGDDLHAWGRLASSITHRGIPHARVAIDLGDGAGRAVIGRVEVQTDATGTFAQTVHLPAGRVETFAVRASEIDPDATDAVASASLSVTTLVPHALGTMNVRVAAGQPVVRPGEPVTVTVAVRTTDGRPVRGASVTSPWIPNPSSGGRPYALHTDARGRAQFTFRAPDGSTPLHDLPIAVSATRTGVGSADASTSIRVARVNLFAAASVEGGALIPGTHGRMFVRVVRADGAPAPAGVHVGLHGVRFPAGLAADTDADGTAVIDTTLLPPPGGTGTANADRCGGGTATGFEVDLTMGTDHGSLEGCVPIDPDATVRVRIEGSPVVAPGAALHVVLERTAASERLPVEVAFVARGEDGLTPLTTHRVAAGAREATVSLPADLRGVVLVRARPLSGAGSIAVRGGVAVVWVTQGTRFQVAPRVDAAVEHVRVDVSSTGALDGAEGTVVVLPREEAEALLARIRGRAGAAPIGDLRVDPARAGDAILAGALAALVEPDDAAPAVLREGVLVPMPAPEHPETRGTLRDPWRARARFVEGRLALVFRQIEDHIASSVLHGRDNVAVRDARGTWTFNREIFDAILSGGDGTNSGGPRALGGDLLTIEVLQHLDPAFTYDNVARRITRRRMFAILLALRHFVNDHALDLRWSWRGDPTTWLTALHEQNVPYDSVGDTLTPDEMVDGWGQPFRLVPSRGGYARFGFVAPVAGFDLVSAGPDGRVGSGDDVVDPTARVLPSAGAYGRAVDEDGLLARLHGVELGRATITRLNEVFGVSTDVSMVREDAGAATSRWSEVPSRVEADPHALDLVRTQVWSRADVTSWLPLGAGGGVDVPIHIDDEPRTYEVIVDGWSADGYPTHGAVAFTAGTPLIVEVPLPPGPEEDRSAVPRVRVGEPVQVEATLTNLTDAVQTYRLVAHGEGAVEVAGPTTLQVPPGEIGTVSLTLRGTTAGPGTVSLAIRDAQNAVLREVRAPVRVDRGALELRDDIATWVHGDGPTSLSFDAPSGRTRGDARLVVTTAAGLADDPELGRVREGDPALIAWAYTLASRPIPAPLGAALLQVGTAGRSPMPRASSALSTACAIVAWSAADEDDAEASQARSQAVATLPSLRGTMPDAEGPIPEASAVLAALATGSVGADDAGDTSDPVAAYAERLRSTLRDALRASPGEPTLLARAAAALLLVDPTDGRGEQLFAAARRAVGPSELGTVVRASDARRTPAEELIGTAALAVAAQQVGDQALVARLAPTIARYAHVSMRLGGEATFWLLATTSYGVFGLAAPASAQISVADGPAHLVDLASGHAVIPIAAGESTRARIAVTGHDAAQAVLFARLEVQGEQRYAERNEGDTTLHIDGDPGYAEEVSALELTVRNRTSHRTGRTVVEIQLPAGAGFDEAARAAIVQRQRVRAVELRSGSRVRVLLDPLEAGQSLELPLAVRWLARGRVSGFGVMAYREDQAWRWTALAPRTLDVVARPSDE